VPKFLIDLPASWDEVDLSGAALARNRAAALAATPDPRRTAAVNDMFRQGRAVLRSALSHGALLAAGTATVYDDDVFLAYGMVFAVRVPVGQEMTLPVLSAQLGGAAGGRAGRVVSSVEVPAVGPVARVTGTETTRLSGDLTADLVTMHTMVPVPGRPQDFLTITLASPNLRLREAVLDLFDALTSTFRFVGADPARRP
jgi:hypothetical protein